MVNRISGALSGLCQLLARLLFGLAAFSFIAGLAYAAIATIFEHELLGMDASQISLLGAAWGAGFVAAGGLFLYLRAVCAHSLSGTTS